MGYLDDTGLATLWARIKQLKLANPYKLTFTGASTGSYDGSSAVTVNIPSGGGGGEDSLFIATYGETTYEELQAAHNAGKAIIVKDTYVGVDHCYYLTQVSRTLFWFEETASSSNKIWWCCCSSSGWNGRATVKFANPSQSNTFTFTNDFQGTTTAVTKDATDNSTNVATTAFVQAAIAASGGGGTELPTGTVNIFAGSTAPDGWLLCKGQAVSRTTYADLFAVIGTTYGYTSSTTFNLPNLCNNVPVGAGGSYSLGDTGGESTHTLSTTEMPSHTHSQSSHNHTQNSHTHTQYAHTHTQNSHTHTQAAHTHTPYTSDNNFVSYNYSTTQSGVGERAVAKASSGNYMAPVINNANADFMGHGSTGSTIPTINPATATNQSATATNYSTTATNQATTATNQNTGGSGAHNNMQPYVAMNYIIKY